MPRIEIDEERAKRRETALHKARVDEFDENWLKLRSAYVRLANSTLPKDRDTLKDVIALATDDGELKTVRRIEDEPAAAPTSPPASVDDLFGDPRKWVIVYDDDTYVRAIPRTDQAEIDKYIADGYVPGTVEGKNILRKPKELTPPTPPPPSATDTKVKIVDADDHSKETGAEITLATVRSSPKKYQPVEYDPDNGRPTKVIEVQENAPRHRVVFGRSSKKSH